MLATVGGPTLPYAPISSIPGAAQRGAAEEQAGRARCLDAADCGGADQRPRLLRAWRLRAAGGAGGGCGAVVPPRVQQRRCVIAFPEHRQIRDGLEGMADARNQELSGKAPGSTRCLQSGQHGASMPALHAPMPAVHAVPCSLLQTPRVRCCVMRAWRSSWPSRARCAGQTPLDIIPIAVSCLEELAAQCGAIGFPRPLLEGDSAQAACCVASWAASQPSRLPTAALGPGLQQHAARSTFKEGAKRAKGSARFWRQWATFEKRTGDFDVSGRAVLRCATSCCVKPCRHRPSGQHGTVGCCQFREAAPRCLLTGASPPRPPACSARRSCTRLRPRPTLGTTAHGCSGGCWSGGGGSWRRQSAASSAG